MVSCEVVVQSKVGLHSRPATCFVQKANEFKSVLYIEKEEKRINAKSLLGILSLGILCDTKITLIADGADEREALEALRNLAETSFE